MIVVINGVFDILHIGHIKLFKYAKSLAEKVQLIVLIDSDDRVKELKGSSRPINSQNKRLEMLQAIKYIDYVLIFYSEKDLILYLKAAKPDVMVKGADYRGKPIIGAEFCKEIHYVELTDDSTTKTIQSISTR